MLNKIATAAAFLGLWQTAPAQIEVLKNAHKNGRASIVLLNNFPFNIDSVKIGIEGGEIKAGGIKAGDIILISSPQKDCPVIFTIEYWPKKEDEK